MKDRADKILVQLGLTKSRSQAAQLIEDGVVFFRGKMILKPSEKITDADIEIRMNELYVGRGAKKIQGAFEQFKIVANNLIVADIGASTGGFSDFVLKQGAKKVYAIDVGHDQLDSSLKENPKVINMEGINIKYPLELPEKVDLAVVDLSYISLKLTLENIFSLVTSNGKVLALVKPQFEVGKEYIGKGGIVKDQQSRYKMLEDLYHWCLNHHLIVSEIGLSPIQGKMGNHEYFFYFDRQKEGACDIQDALQVIRSIEDAS